MIRQILLGLVLTLTVTAASARPFTQADLVGLERVSNAHVSPDGGWAAYELAVLDAAANTRRRSVWVVATDGQNTPVKLADGASPQWGADANSLYYLAKGQVWTICRSCKDARPRQVTDLPLDVGTFRVAPGGRHLVVSMAVFPDLPDPAASQARLAQTAASKAKGRLYDKLFVRHWDRWADGRRNHLYAIALKDGGAVGSAVPLMPGFDGDSPSQPSGGDEDYSITPDGETVVFSARLAGRTEAWSVNFDLYSVPIDGSAPPRNATASNPAWDLGAVWSPDGRRAAYRATARPGFEADRFGIVVTERDLREGRALAADWDRSARALAFAGDGRSLYAVAGDVQHQKIFQIDLASGSVKPLTTKGRVSSLEVAHGVQGDVIVYTLDTMAAPPQVYALRPGKAPVQLTHVADRQLAEVEMSAYESFRFSGWNDETVHGWIVKPHGWTPGAKFPTILMIHGGPESSQQDAWSTRWNPAVWAGWGYGVVMIDFHGSTGYGQAFTDAAAGHWGDRPLEDLRKGWAAAQARAGWIDGSRACAAGYSYGGYMAFWMAGVWSSPWKCFVAHNGVFDTRMMGHSTEELWASEWEFGRAPPWEKPEAYEQFNPVRHADAWRTPMLVIHSDLDFRLPVDQGLAAFTVLQRKGVPSQFLNFPDENHWVLKPANSLQWHDTIQAWLSTWIGPDARAAPRGRP